MLAARFAPGGSCGATGRVNSRNAGALGLINLHDCDRPLECCRRLDSGGDCRAKRAARFW